MNGWTSEERAAILSRSFDARGLGEVRLLEVGDGPGRGQRLLQLTNADGIELEIAVDRGFDLARLRYRGTNIGWLGPTDYPAPIVPDAQSGLGSLGSFDGFLVTGGLDHHGLPTQGSAAHLRYANRTKIEYPLHGRVNATPARLLRVERVIQNDEPSLICEGVVRQTSLFGATLELRRTIKLPLLGGPICLEDRVTNLSHRVARHAMLYHFNIGYPLLDIGTELSGVLRPPDWSLCEGPTSTEQSAETFELVDPLEQEKADIGLFSPSRNGLALSISYCRSQLPQLGIWRAYQEGVFALGLEPHTYLRSADIPPESGAIDVLDAGETRCYDLRISLCQSERLCSVARG
ncbi:DUF4432 family protein [Pseudomonas sp. PS01302]|uniref:DUF4432 family protein n=1 Tax=Pseudomonas sp. PS01302 TaxID=2991438 RepID=UPI00249A23F3|nr:DUF4432 family protein [Pseudomonas sp. PS01302]